MGRRQVCLYNLDQILHIILIYINSSELHSVTLDVCFVKDVIILRSDLCCFLFPGQLYYW